jgi:hypothetical protein
MTHRFLNGRPLRLPLMATPCGGGGGKSMTMLMELNVSLRQDDTLRAREHSPYGQDRFGLGACTSGPVSKASALHSGLAPQ